MFASDLCQGLVGRSYAATRLVLRLLVQSTVLIGLSMMSVGTTRAEGPADPSATEAGRAAPDEKTSTTDSAIMISVHGTVLDAAGNPVAGATVYVCEWATYQISEDPYNRDPQDVLARMQTGDDGAFRFENVPAQRFRRSRPPEAPWDVIVIAEGYGMAWRHLRKVQDETAMTLTMPPEARLTGRIVDDQGEPVAGIEVKVGHLTDLGSDVREGLESPGRINLWVSRLAPKVSSDANGRFTIGGLPPDKRALLLATNDEYGQAICYAATTDQTQPGLADVSYSGGERRRITHEVHTGDFTIALQPAFHVVGRVVAHDGGQPVPEAKVMLQWENRGLYAIADAEGRFSFHGLSEPDWYVHASPPEDSDRLRRRIRVPSMSDDKRTAAVEVELPRGEEITGSVVDEETGDGVPGVRAYFRQDVPEDAPDATYSTAATTDENGGFRVVAPPGKGALIISGAVEGYNLPAHVMPGEEPDPRYARSIEVKPGEPIRGVQFRLGRGLVIKGRVTDPDGKPVAGAEVKTWSTPHQRVRRATTQSDEEGRFTLGGFPPPTGLVLHVRHRDRRLVGRASVVARDQAGTSRLVNVDVQLEEAASVQGRVFVDGEPTAGFRVDLLQREMHDGESYGVPVEHAITDDAGAFQLDIVPPRTECYVSTYSALLSSPTFVLKAGQVHDLGTFKLRSKSLNVAGIVVDPEGNPVEGVTVSARERSGQPIAGAFTRSPTGKDGRFVIEGVPKVPLALMAYIRNPPDSNDRTVRFAAKVDAMPGEKDVRIVLDPGLQRGRPERIEPVRRE